MELIVIMMIVWACFSLAVIMITSADVLHDKNRIVRHGPNPKGYNSIYKREAQESLKQNKRLLRLALLALVLSPLAFVLAPVALVCGLLYVCYKVVRLAFEGEPVDD